ncbi:MAG: alpha-2-macroglobulin [Pirellulaceae bacterium]|nr:alpha-2-macroglobulin [Pirellulaceae bacterium]
MKKGLPKTAIEKLEPIIAAALREKAYAEAVKAIGQKIALEGNIQGNKPEEKIRRMEAEIEAAPAEMKPVLQAILANWYWHYFQQNRWRFMQRTQTAAPPGDDFTTWDLPRIFAEIDKQFQQVLAAAEILQKIPIADYDELLEKGNAPDAYRPTLYDFLAHDALEFYASGEQAAARAQDAFDLRADSPVFGSVADFLAWKPETTDEDAPTLKAVRLYQNLLRFHQADDDRSALLDADLGRLEFGHNKAFGEEKDARYLAALKRFADEHAAHEISTRAIHNWASLLHSQGEFVEAREVARQGLARFPDSVGGRRCFNLIQQIEARESQVTTERVWSEPLPTVDVTYRNVTKIHFRVVPYDFDEHVRSGRWGAENLDQNQRRALLGKTPVRSWSADLPATEDYQQRVEQLAAPKDLPQGSYYLIASHDQQFRPDDNLVTFAEFWVSNLALVVRTRQGDGVLEGFVLNAVSGEPIAGATVRGWGRGNRNQLVAVNPVKTDNNGLFRFAGNQLNAFLLLAEHEGQRLSSVNYFYVNRYDSQERPNEQTLFFTDRSLYRPGQTIQYKGIAIAVDHRTDNYQVIKGRNLVVIFQDVNGKEIERLTHRTNDYGSFSGSFTAPRDRLMGRMTIRTDGQPAGAAQVSVEEYKRPKFQVAVEPPKEAARLNGDVQVVGKATAYTGAAIDGAKVRWRVVRQVRYPVWWYWRCWWMPPNPGQSQEIAHGTAVTESNGSFPVQFTARPDLSVPAESEPTFEFTIFADVTDTTGETRSAQRSIRVGYTALSATLAADDWQVRDKPAEITVRTATLDGEGQAAEGTLKVYQLRQPREMHRPPLSGRPLPYAVRRAKGGELQAPPPDPTNPNSWPLGAVVFEQGVTTDAGGNARLQVPLPTGVYRAQLETTDRFGKAVTAQLPLQVLDPSAGKLELKIPNLLAAPKWSLEPGEEFLGVWGSGYDQARAFVEVEHRNKLLQSFWTEPGATQLQIKQQVAETMRGGFTLRVTMVRENRAYLESRRIEVPWTNKQLTIKWEHFVSKLAPAQKETWTAVITGPDAKQAVAELVAGLYDASLDAYLPHSWRTGFGVFRTDYSRVNSQFENTMKYFQPIYSNWQLAQKDGSLTYRHFPAEIIGNFYGYAFFGGGRGGGRGLAPMAATAAPGQQSNRRFSADGLAQEKGAENQLRKAESLEDRNADAAKSPSDAGAAGAEPGPDLSQVSARTNLNETAFFLPHLVSSDDGTVRMEFTMPEALTEWKFLGFAHDAQLRGGLLTDKTVTAKDLMIQPNPPRFLREGDLLEFTVKVSNQSPTAQQGQVRLTLADAASGSSVDSLLGNQTLDQAFDIPAGESKSFSWKLQVPDDLGFLTYKAVGSTGRLSDGEEGYLPVLSRRVLVTESLPLPIRGPQSKEFAFDRLLQSGQSDSLKHKSLTVQMVSNPSWYAVMALPYLMEFPHQCTEQTFNRLYANSLARHIAASDPKIRRVFDVWKLSGGDTLDSPLEKNEDLKAVALEETPWVRQAAAESQARRNVGILFDDNRLNSETAALLRKLADQQYEDGAWPWFPGGPANDYITLYITTGFGRLRHLGVAIDVAPAVKSLRRLDAWVTEMHNRIPADQRDKNHLSTLIALYLYGRSFFLEDQAVAPEHKPAVDYWLGQARKYWLQLAVRQSQGHLAIALNRFGDAESARGIMASIKERSVSDEELGMFWRDQELSWWWYRAPIETQAVMIEAFDEVAKDPQSVEDCKVWLLKQKQTQDWKTTKATADAIYALLLRGTNLLASDALVELSLGGELIEPEKVEAGTGFYEERFAGREIQPELGRITVKKVDQGVAWGSVHWQYLEDMSKVTAYEGTPLKLTKQLFTKTNTRKGPVLEPVEGPVAVGDELVVRVVLRTDRDMEYVHLKDYRGSGTEPVNVLSQYKFQDGLYYYESTRDAASHFFIDYLPKGTYVFEYSVRVQHKGKYQTGFAAIQCMYAPEFNGHSESLVLEVQ